MGSHDYYNGVCKMCLVDCDGDFCSSECREEWESGKIDYDYDRMKELELDKQLGLF